MKQNTSLDTDSGEPNIVRSANEALINVDNVSVRYRGTLALSDVSFSIGANRITALIGPSGCGKSSFLGCLNRMSDMIPGCHVSGTVKFGGENLLDPEIDVVNLRRRIGMIFQKPNPFPMSIRKNIEMPLREHGIRNRRRLREIVEKALVDVGLWGEVHQRLDQSALALSGGQQQRLCIARAIALQPEVLLLDEPCSALDPISSGVVEDLIVSLRETYTLVVVTHNLHQAKRIADDLLIFWLRDGSGKLIAAGPAEDVFENPQDPDARNYLDGQRE